MFKPDLERSARFIVDIRRFLLSRKIRVPIMPTPEGRLLEIDQRDPRLIQDRILLAAYEAHLRLKPPSVEAAKTHIARGGYCATCLKWVMEYRKKCDPNQFYEPRAS